MYACIHTYMYAYIHTYIHVYICRMKARAATPGSRRWRWSQHSHSMNRCVSYIYVCVRMHVCVCNLARFIRRENGPDVEGLRSANRYVSSLYMCMCKHAYVCEFMRIFRRENGGHEMLLLNNQVCVFFVYVHVHVRTCMGYRCWWCGYLANRYVCIRRACVCKHTNIRTWTS